MSHLQRVMDVRWARKREKQGESREADPAFSVCVLCDRSWPRSNPVENCEENSLTILYENSRMRKSFLNISVFISELS